MRPISRSFQRRLAWGRHINPLRGPRLEGGEGRVQLGLAEPGLLCGRAELGVQAALTPAVSCTLPRAVVSPRPANPPWSGDRWQGGWGCHPCSGWPCPLLCQVQPEPAGAGRGSLQASCWRLGLSKSKGVKAKARGSPVGPGTLPSPTLGGTSPADTLAWTPPPGLGDAASVQLPSLSRLCA